MNSRLRFLIMLLPLVCLGILFSGQPKPERERVENPSSSPETTVAANQPVTQAPATTATPLPHAETFWVFRGEPAGDAEGLSKSLAAISRGQNRLPSGRRHRIEGFPNLRTLQEGAKVSMSLPDGRVFDGTVNWSRRDEGYVDTHQVSIGFTGDKGGLVAIHDGTTGRSQGRLLVEHDRLAWTLEPENDGSLWLVEHLREDMVCELPTPVAAARANPLPGDPGVAGNGGVQPTLNSRPSATAVLYIDFDGQPTQVYPDWPCGSPATPIPVPHSGLTADQMTAVWRRVSEDFIQFNINVSTEPAKYNAASVGSRMRILVAGTLPPDSSPPTCVGSAGLAYPRSFQTNATSGGSFSSTVPCWLSVNAYGNPASMDASEFSSLASNITHEFGHTLGLFHDGAAGDSDGYYDGHGTAPFDWSPIMGSPYRPGAPGVTAMAIIQWAKDDYPGANNSQDDLAIIAGGANGFGYAADESVGYIGAHEMTSTGANQVGAGGVIANKADFDWWHFTVRFNGETTIEVAPADTSTSVPNLDCGFRIEDGFGNEVEGPLALTDNLEALGSFNLPPGSYYVVAFGTGNRSFNNSTGYNDYGSTGRYLVTVNLPPDTEAPTAEVLSPANGAVLTSPSLVFSGTAHDNDQVSARALYLRRNADNAFWNGTIWQSGYAGAALASNYTPATGDWSCTSPLPTVGGGGANSMNAGSYTFIVIAEDPAGLAFEAASHATVDSTGPGTNVTSPVPGSTLGAPGWSFSGTVTDNGGVSEVVLYIRRNADGNFWNGSAWQASATGAELTSVLTPIPLSTSLHWDCTSPLPVLGTTLTPGSYSFIAIGVDNLGNPLEAESVVTVDGTSPVTEITEPLHGTTLTSSGLSFRGRITDNAGVKNVVLFIRRHSDNLYWDGGAWVADPFSAGLSANYNAANGTWFCNDSLPAPGSTLSNGGYNFIAMGFDHAGNSHQTDSVVTVEFYQSYFWTAGSYGDLNPSNDNDSWDNSANWWPNGVPGDGDIVTISSGNVESTSSRTVREYRMYGGTLNFSAAGTLTPTLSAVWSDGTITGTFSIPAGVTLAVNPGTQRTLGDAGLIENRGLVIQEATAPITGYNTVRIENKFGGVWRINGGGDPFEDYYGGNTFLNEGLLEKTGEGTVTLNQWLFDMPNEVRSSGGILDFASESLFPSGALLSGSATIWWSGHEDLQGAVTQTAAFLKLMTGNLTCSANATIIGTWDWEGGTIDNTIHVLNGSILRIQGDAGRWLGTSAVLANEGTVRWVGPGAITGIGGSTITNAAGARFEIMNGGDLFDNYNGGNVFQNDGLLVKVAGSAATILNEWAFHSPGELKTEFGPLEVNAPLTLPSGAKLSGTGTQKWLSDIVTLTGTITLTCPLEVDGATVNVTGPGILTNDWTWKSGHLNGQFNIPAGKRLTVQGAGEHFLDTDTVINNFGIMKWEGPAPITGVGSITWNNKPGSRITLNADGEPFADYNAGNVLVNESTINKSGGGGVTTVSFWELRNSDEIRADAGGLDFTGQVHWLAGTRLRGPGTIRQRGYTHLDAPVLLEAPVQFYEGTLTAVPAASIAGALEWRSGNLEGTCRILSGATLRIVAGDKTLTDSSIIENSGTVDWQSGDLTGVGSVLLDNLSGSTFRTSSSGSFIIYNGGNKIRVAAGAQMLKTGAVTAHIDWAVDNNGTCDVQQGTLFLEDGGSSAGTFTAASGATLVLAADEFRLKNGASVSGAGTNQITDALVLAEGTASGHFNLQGTGTLGNTGAGVMTLTGANHWTQGYLEGGVTVAAGATLTIATANLKQLNSSTMLSNRGTLEIQPGSTILGFGSNTLHNLAGATLRIAPGVTLTEYNSLNRIQNDGTLEITGTGTVASPWDFTQSATGTLRVPVAAAGPGLTSGVLDTSVSTLAGNFIAVVPAGLTPTMNAEFFPLTYGSRTGAFASVLASTGGAWQATYETDRMKIKVAGGQTFTSWATAAGLSGPNALSNADPDGDGQTNFAEYVYNSDPKKGGAAPHSTGVIEIGGQDWLVLRYRRWTDREAAGVVYQAESGQSLGSWSSAGVTEELDPDAAPIGGSTPYRSRVPITPGVSKFLRIKAIR